MTADPNVDELDDLDDLDAAEVQALFQAALARTREVPEALSLDELLVLALPPFWPEPLLQRVVGTPEAVEALLARAGSLVHARGRPGERAIELVDPDHPQVVARVRQAPGLLERTAALAAQIRSSGLEPPPVLAQWVALVERLEALGDYGLARELAGGVGEACRQDRPGSVQDRVEAAAALARTFGPPLSGAVRAAQHRIGYWHRIQRDRRKLAYFVPRGPALAAFDRLRTGPPQEWALHYVGVGGTGKTSLIRYLATRVAAEQGLQIARIDFDHLSPTYPARDPGQLFATLLYELTPLIETERQDRLLGFLDSALETLRQSPLPATSNVQAILDTPAVAELTSWFGSLLQTFPRPTLILDTCEELTKLELVDGLIPSVEATFLLLERFHELAPNLRVVFAGRRLLAREYANWRLPDELARCGGSSTRRGYVRLHELRGFDRGEAVDFLEKRLPAARRDDTALVEKLLALSPEPLRVQALAAPDPDAGELHYNPFDLSRYGDWVEAEPEVRIEALDAAGVDPYVEVRIIHRMGPLEALLPAVALLRRFDAAMLGDALPPGADPDPAFDELARHEWLRIKELPDRTILEVDRGLPERIERALAVDRGAEVELARAQLGGKLRERIRAAKLPAIPVEVFDGALRLLPPEEAAALWRSIEQRIDAEADWAWATELGRKLIADGYAAESAESAVRIYILATMASALIHAGMVAEARRLWREIEEGAARVLERCAAERAGAAAAAGRSRRLEATPAWLLHQRARLGRAAARAGSAHSGPAGDPGGLGELGELAKSVATIAGELQEAGRAHELETSLCAALEALAEAAERTPERTAPELLALRPLARFRAPGLDAFGRILAARFELLGEPGDHSRAALAALALPIEDLQLPPALLDWRPPESLRDRLRLELVRMNRHLGTDLATRAPGWLAEASTETTDGDRLASALALYHGAAPNPSMVRRTTTAEPGAETLVWTGEERCAAHRQYPPLGFALARSALLRGDLDTARAAIRELPQPWSARLACETARWSRSAEDLDSIGPEESFDPQTAFEIASARAIVEGTLASGLVGELIARAEPGRELPALAAVHPDLRDELIRQKLRAHAMDGSRRYDGPETQVTIAAAIEEAELLDLRFPERAGELFAWAEQAADRAGLANLRRRAHLGAHHVESTQRPRRSPGLEARGIEPDDRPPAIRIMEVTRTAAMVVLEGDRPAGRPPRSSVHLPRPGISLVLEDQGFAAALRDLARSADRVAVKLDPDPSLSTRCWEAALYSLDPRLLLPRLDCYRVLPGGPPASAATPGPLQVVAAGTMQRIVRSAWGARAGIVHAVRRFSRSLRGQVLITQDFRRDPVANRAILEELQLDGARLLVLQCDPVDAGPQIAADLAEPELARELATDMLRRTDAAALILPPVPVDLADSLAGVLAREAGELSPRELLSTARAVRLHLADRGQARLAQEITLFLRTDLPR